MIDASKTDTRATEGTADGVFDRQHLSRYTLGDAALERELLQLFADQVEKSLAQIKTAGSASEWKLACHTLKGSAAAVGAAEINRLAAGLERRGFTGTPHPGDAEVTALEHAAQRFRETVGRSVG